MTKNLLQMFQRAKAEVPETFKLHGDFLIVETIDPEEFQDRKSIIIADTVQQVNSFTKGLPTLVKVLLAGEGYYDDETKEPVDLDTKPGAILLIGKNSISEMTGLGPISVYSGTTKLGLTKESEAIMSWESREAFDKFFAVAQGE